MKLIHFAMAAAAMLYIANPAQAQDEGKKKQPSKFGKFARMVGETATGINMSNDIIILIDPNMQKLATIEEEGLVAEGNPATGEVLVSIPVKAKGERRDIWLGRWDTDFAADTKGTKFKVEDLYDNKNTFVEINPDVPTVHQYVIKDVPADLASIELLNLRVKMRAEAGNLPDVQIRNIAIKWREAVAENIVAEPYALLSLAEITVASCEGDKKTGNVTVTLSVTTTLSTSTNLDLIPDKNYGGGCFAKNGKTFDVAGEVNEYNNRIRKDLSKDVPTTFAFNIAGVDPADDAIYLLKLGYKAIYAVDDISKRIDVRTPDKSHLNIKNIKIDWKE